jgi:hypothetical protein
VSPAEKLAALIHERGSVTPYEAAELDRLCGSAAAAARRFPEAAAIIDAHFARARHPEWSSRTSWRPALMSLAHLRVWARLLRPRAALGYARWRASLLERPRRGPRRRASRRARSQRVTRAGPAREPDDDEPVGRELRGRRGVVRGGAS